MGGAGAGEKEVGRISNQEGGGERMKNFKQQEEGEAWQERREEVEQELYVIKVK